MADRSRSVLGDVLLCDVVGDVLLCDMLWATRRVLLGNVQWAAPLTWKTKWLLAGGLGYIRASAGSRCARISGTYTLSMYLLPDQ